MPAGNSQGLPPPVSENVSEPSESGAKVSESPPEVQDLSDVAAFGNDTESAAHKGPLCYDLSISGVDSSDVEKAVLSVLEDSRLKLDAKFILKTTKNGRINIKNLNPVKMVYMLSRLMHLPVKFDWKQYMAINALEEKNEKEGEESENRVETD